MEGKRAYLENGKLFNSLIFLPHALKLFAYKAFILNWKLSGFKTNFTFSDK